MQIKILNHFLLEIFPLTIQTYNQAPIHDFSQGRYHWRLSNLVHSFQLSSSKHVLFQIVSYHYKKNYDYCDMVRRDNTQQHKCAQEGKKYTHEIVQLFRDHHISIILIIYTTAQYLTHWCGVKKYHRKCIGDNCPFWLPLPSSICQRLGDFIGYFCGYFEFMGVYFARFCRLLGLSAVRWHRFFKIVAVA